MLSMKILNVGMISMKLSARGCGKSMKTGPRRVLCVLWEKFPFHLRGFHLGAGVFTLQKSGEITNSLAGYSAGVFFCDDLHF